MTFDWTFNIGNILTVILVTVAGISAFAYQSYAVAQAKTMAEAAAASAKEMQIALTEFRLMVAERYIHVDDLDKLEKRMSTYEERMIIVLKEQTKRLDTVLGMLKTR